MKKLLFLALFFVSISFSLQSQWIQTNGPYGAFHPNDIFKKDSLTIVSAYNGVFLKTPSIPDWQSIIPLYYGKLFLTGNTLVFDGGYFIGLMDLADPDYKVDSIFGIYNPSAVLKNNTIFAAGGGGFYVSYDLDTLLQFNNGIIPDTFSSGYNYYTADVEYINNSIFTLNRYGLYKTDEALSSYWSLKFSFPPNISNSYNMEVVGDTLFVSYKDKVYKSIDEGENWTLFYDSVGTTSLSSIAYFDGSYYIVVKNNRYQSNVLKSNDQGVSWSTYSTGLIDSSYANFVKVVDDTLFCGQNIFGLSFLDGNQWKDYVTGTIVSSNISSMKQAHGKIFISDQSGVYYLAGNNWVEVSPDSAYKVYYTRMAVIDDELFVITVDETDTITRNYLYHSADGGINWDTLSIPDQVLYQFVSSQFKGVGQNLFLYDRYIAFRSSDKGLTWDTLAYDPNSWPTYNIEDIIEYKGELLATMYDVSKIYKYNEQSDEWQQVSGRSFGTDEKNFVLRDSVLLIKTPEKLYINDGPNLSDWSRQSYFSSTSINDYCNSDSALMVVGLGGVFYSLDTGKTWVDYTDNFIPSFSRGQIVLYNDTLYASSEGNGVFKRPLPHLTISIKENAVHEYEMVLYPNPAHSSFSIKTKNNASGNFTILDINGRMVSSGAFYVNEKIQLNNIKAGTYIISVISNGKIFTEKLLVK